MFDEVTLSIRCNNDKIESLGMTVSIEIGLPTEKSKVHQFQICCARTKYLSEIHRGRTIIVCASKLFSPIHLDLKGLSAKIWVNSVQVTFEDLL